MRRALLVIMLVMMLAGTAFSWDATIKETRKDADTLFVDTIFTDGVNTERIEVPFFQPKTLDEVKQGLKNRAATLDRKYKSEADIVILKPDVDKEKDKPFPCDIVIE